MKPVAPWRLVKVEAGNEYRLDVTFMDGLKGFVDVSQWLKSNRIEGSLFEKLRDQAFFRQVTIELGVITWPNGADLSPAAIYDAIQQTGCWKPELTE